MAEENNDRGFDPETAHLSSDQLADLILSRSIKPDLTPPKRPTRLQKDLVGLPVVVAAAVAFYGLAGFLQTRSFESPPLPVIIQPLSLPDYLRDFDGRINHGDITLQETAPEIINVAARAICPAVGCEPDEAKSRVQLVSQDTFRQIVSQDHCQNLDPDTLSSFAGTGQNPVINEGHILAKAPTSQATEIFRQAVGEITRNPREIRLNSDQVQKGPVTYTKNGAGCFTADSWQIKLEQAMAENEVSRLMQAFGIKTQIPLPADVLKSYDLIRNTLFGGNVSELLRYRYQSDPEKLYFLVGSKVFEVFSNQKDIPGAEKISMGQTWLNQLFS